MINFSNLINKIEKKEKQIKLKLKKKLYLFIHKIYDFGISDK
jgi:hypothetical protein